jgi:hypothetical protein
MIQAVSQFQTTEEHRVYTFKLGSSAVRLEEFPDYLCSIELVTDLPYQKNRQILRTAGPGVTAAFDDIDNYLGSVSPAAVHLPMNLSAVTG